MKILFITNGHGEDIIAARIIKEIQNEQIFAFPLVGEGKSFEELKNVEILGSRKKMPSGGFVYQSFSNIVKDIFSGLIGNTLEQIKTLKILKGTFDKVIAIGDIVPIIGSIIVSEKFIFIGCAKSDYYDYSYTPWEKFLLKKRCKMCFPRDEKTTENLISYGIKCAYVGNPMMDCIETTNEPFNKNEYDFTIGLLPGTRDDFYLNLEDMITLSEHIDKIFQSQNKKNLYLISATKEIDISKYTNKENVILATNKFGDVISQSDLIIGLSGTGNEQAAGLGKPIVSFTGRGVQYTSSFAKRQKQLLGDAIFVGSRNFQKTAQKVWEILTDKTLMQKMATCGKKRMGPKGAAKKIAYYIKNENWL